MDLFLKTALWIRKNLPQLLKSLMFFIETHYYQRAMRPEVPGVLASHPENGIEDWPDQ